MGKAKKVGPKVAIGDPVWVWTGIHEDLGTVVEIGCELDHGKDGIRVKFNVSASGGIFPPTDVRPQIDTGKRASRSTATVATPARQMVSPSPKADEPGVSGKRTRAAPKPAATKRLRTASKEKPLILEDTKEAPKTSSPHFKIKALELDDDDDEAATALAEAENGTKLDAKMVLNRARALQKVVLKSEPKIHAKRKISVPKEDDNENKSKSELKKQVKGKPGNEDDDEKKSKPRLTKQVKRKPAARKENDNETKPKKSQSKPTKVSKTIIAVDSDASENDADFDDAANNDDDSVANDDAEDMPFMVEYSATGRATCRRCDTLVQKGEVRVSHVPLFRGKPGYRVYRHLHCAVFSDEIASVEDIGGWQKLTSDDLEKLVNRIEESKIELEKENEELQPDELVPVSYQGVIRAPPLGLAGDMLPFQTEGVSWMHNQEVNEAIHGGILADEMGMGKTLQTIVTILDNRPRLQHSQPGAKHPPSLPDLEARKAEDALWNVNLDEWNHEMKMNNVPASMLKKMKAGGSRGGTLVICPVIAISQWKAEIEKFTEGDTLTVGTYHGPNRASEMPLELLCKYDVVLTTYQVIESDFRKMTSPNKVKCPNCGAKYKVDKLRVHLKYFCGDGAQRTEAQARQRRRGGGPQGRGGTSGSKNNPLPGKKASETSSEKKKFKKSPSVRIKSRADYDSESDLSVAESTQRSNGARRTSRSAALSATKKMATMKPEWGASGDGESGDEYSQTEDYGTDESLEDENSKGNSTKVSPPDKTKNEKEVEVVRQLQSKLMKQMKNAGKKSKGLPKKGIERGKSKFKDDDEDSEGNADPMESIDMDKLLKEAMDGSQMSILHSICWWRIVLDEAHMIKSRSSQTANAAFALTGIHRWCLSGTPLQNRVGEFYSLIRFLRIDPMAHYFCRKKGCECKSLNYRMLNGKCQDCGHGSVQHYSHFNKHVLNPIQRSGYSGDGRRAMFTLKNEVLDKSLLRRTKETRAEDMNLPPRLVSIRTVRLHPVEEDFYNALYTQTQSSFNDYVSDGVALNNYAHLFDLLMRMRQAVCHPYLVVYSKKGFSEQASTGNGSTVANGSTDCDICHEHPTDRVHSSCCHAAFCQSCVRDYLSINAGEGGIPCPSCRQPFSIDLNQVTEEEPAVSSAGSSDPMPLLKDMANVATGSILRRINLREFATSTKIEALVEELVRMRQTSPGSKAIVFSQFVNMLDLIRWRLHSDPHLAKMGLGYRALHGGMNVKARDVCLKDFKEDSSVRVLLMSLKAGGVALNLTVANHIYLMDPWWNPAAEMQAIDRTHRLGQYRPIRAVRFIAEDTVEERIVQLQDKKRLVFDGTIGRDAGSLQTLSLDDMKSLFA